MLVSGSYFGVLGLTPAAGRLLGPDDDRTPGAHQVAVLSHALLADPLRDEPGRLGETLDRQRRADDDHRRRPARASPAPRSAPCRSVFVPLSMRERLVAGWKGFDNRRNYWAYVFARLQPGATIEQAQAAVNVPYRAIINDVEAPLQKGMSEATMARFRAKRGHRRARRRRARAA